MAGKVADHEPWPLRAAGLAVLGAVLAVIFNFLVFEGQYRETQDPLRLAGASFVAVAGITFAFAVERVRALWSVAFAAAAGLVVALVFYWNGSPDGWSAGDQWRIFAALIVVAIAAPLLQTARDAGRWGLDYEPVHAHAWTNLVLWFAAWAFVLVSWLLAQLLAQLFNLIGIDLLRQALRESWFNLAIVGAALGGAIGLLRDRDKVLGMLQRVATTVLSVLAPVLASGLVLFVLALPFTGLQPLWDKTTATTPILLVAIAGAFLLANAIIGNSPEEEAKGRALRLSAAALAAAMAPLAIVAAISTWLRIDQHGFTPERLWAATFVLIVLAVSLAYLWTVARGWLGWAGRIRPLNVKLAVGISAVALLLATPLINFGAISTRDQIARLEAGKVKPEEFDWAALRFDFGPSGRRALERIRRSGPTEVRQYADQALRFSNRWDLAELTRVRRRGAQLVSTIRVLPASVPVPEPLRQAVAQRHICGFGECTLFWRPGETQTVAVGFRCDTCAADVTLLRLVDGQWQPNGPIADIWVPRPDVDGLGEQQRIGVAQGRVEIRSVPRRQVFINGQPVGGAFP